MFFYQLCGVKVASEIPLVELSASEIEPTSTPDVEFLIGPTPPLQSPTVVDGQFQLRGAEELRWVISGHGTFLVSEGRRITVEPDPMASDVAVRSALIGRVQYVLWLQRGMVSLHASSVLLGGEAVCFAGPSGAGKSVAAAVLAERGHRIVADDNSVLAMAGHGAHLLPGYDSLRLWDDVADHFQSGRKSAPADASGRKSIVQFEGQELPGQLRVADLVLLAPRGDSFVLERLSEFQLLQRWFDVVPMPVLTRSMGGMPRVVEVLHALFAGGTRVWRATFPNDIEGARAACDQLLDAMARAGR